jgi:retron-type reverse transcriptase
MEGVACSGRTYATLEDKKTMKKNYPRFKKQYKYLYKKILDKDLIRRAFFKMRKGKSKRKPIKRIYENLDEYVTRMYDMLENSTPIAEHPERAFEPMKHNPITIFEHGKERVLYIPSVIEQWVHHIIMQVLAPILTNMFHPDSYGSIPNKGLHKGKKRVLKLRHDNKYMLKLDIRHFFANIRVDILVRKLEVFIKDDWFIALIQKCFKWHPKGLPLGFYLSQWMSNMYLNDLDYLIRDNDINHVRYIDDVVMFGNNKRKLRKCFIKIKQLLGKDRLKVKNNFHLYLSSKEPLSFLGFVFYLNRIRLRKSIARHIRAVAKRLKKNHPIWLKDARRMLSYMGWIKYSDGYTFYLEHIKPSVSIRKLKRLISKMERRKQHDKVDFRNFRPQPSYA